MIPGCLHSATPREHNHYIRRFMLLPLQSPTREPMREYNLFAEIRKAIPKPPTWATQSNEWISEAMWKLINMQVAVRRDPRGGRDEIWCPGRHVRA